MTDNITRACAMCGETFGQFASRYPRLRCYACDPGPKIGTGDRLEHGGRDGDDGMWGNDQLDPAERQFAPIRRRRE